MKAYLILSAALFSIGTYGVIARRNVIIMLISLELMLNGVNVAFAALTLQADAATLMPRGHVFVLIIMAVAAAEVAVGLAIVLALFRTHRTLDTKALNSLRG